MSLDRLTDNLVELRTLAEQIDQSAKLLSETTKTLTSDEILERVDGLVSDIQTVEQEIGRLSAKQVAEAARQLNRATRAVSRGWLGLSACVGACAGFVLTLSVGAWLLHGLMTWRQAYLLELGERYGQAAAVCANMIGTSRIEVLGDAGNRYLIVRSDLAPVRQDDRWYFHLRR